MIDRGELPLERVIFFSDAVMAIAITLLTIDLRLPDATNLTNAQFVDLLAGLAPRYFAFALSFAVIGVYWFAHHRMFRFIVRWTNGLLLLNMVFLFFVVQLPFLASVLGAHGDLAGPTALYALGLAALGFTSAGLWAYAARRGLIADEADPKFVRLTELRQLAAPLVFTLSIPLAFVAPALAQLAWTVVYFGQLLLARHFAAAGVSPPPRR